MIKNLIGAIGMTLIGTMPTNRAETITNNTIKTANTVNKSNIFTNNQYENGLLYFGSENATIQYQDINIQNNIIIKNRARIEVLRYPQDSIYELNVFLITAIETTLNLTDITIDYYTTPPAKNSIETRGSEYHIGHYQTLTTNQTNFIEGQNYNSYAELNALNLNENYSNDDTDIYEGLGYQTGYGPYYYYGTKLHIEYDQGLPGDGTQLYDNILTIDKIRIELTWEAQITPTNYEVIDIPGLMFEILGMPFAWFSLAFNFTLFPGTPYAINISHLLLGLLVSLIAIIIFRIIWRGRA